MPFKKGQSGNPNGRKIGSINKTKYIYKELYDDIVGSFKNGYSYVYYHINKESGEIVYIGKGKHDRAWRFSDKSRNDEWCKYKNENELIVKVVVANLDDEEAIAIERALINTKNPILNKG